MKKVSIKRAALAIVAVVTSALFWLVTFGVGSAVLAGFGVWLEAGLGWAMICAAAYSFLFAYLVFKGMSDG